MMPRAAINARRQGLVTGAAGGVAVVVAAALEALGLPLEVSAPISAAVAGAIGVCGAYARDRRHAGDDGLLLRMAATLMCVPLLALPVGCQSTRAPDGTIYAGLGRGAVTHESCDADAPAPAAADENTEGPRPGCSRTVIEGPTISEEAASFLSDLVGGLASAVRLLIPGS